MINIRWLSSGEAFRKLNTGTDNYSSWSPQAAQSQEAEWWSCDDKPMIKQTHNMFFEKTKLWRWNKILIY